MRTAFLFAVALATCCAAPVRSADWVRFRGPGGLGHGDAENLPVEWSGTKNVVWKTALPGAGSSSTIVLGDRVYLTCYTGYAQSRDDVGDQEDLMRHVVCLDRKSGAIQWQKAFEPLLPESNYRGNGARHGYSTSTPTTDGERLYVFFGKTGVFALDLDDGSEIWRTSVGEKTAGWGSSNSPVLYENLLIVNAAIESGRLVALDKATGKEVWAVDGVRRAWTTPILVEAPDKSTELVLSTPRKVRAFDPADGKELWTCEGIPDGYVCPSPVAHEGVVYLIGGRKNTAMAVKAGGRGDVTESHVLWKTNRGSNVSSPVYYRDHVYFAHERGTLVCLDAETGEEVFQQRLEPRSGLVYSSIGVADGKLYLFSQENGAYVFAAKPEFELLAHNTLGEDDSRINASPVFHDDQILIRSDRAVYCLGRTAAE